MKLELMPAIKMESRDTLPGEINTPLLFLPSLELSLTQFYSTSFILRHSLCACVWLSGPSVLRLFRWTVA